ncbi:MAG: hypothetical protein KC589_09240 [Nanoarchaeota archaeon]|nr:hypothetical protein [Nanoarchaeota archaeon]
MDKKRVDAIEKASDDQLKERFDNGYAKAKQEVLSDFEKSVRDKFSFSSDKKGVDLISELVSSKLKSVKDGAIDPDQIMKSSTYMDMIKQKDDEKLAEIEKIKGSYEDQISSYKKAEVNKVLSEKAMSIIDGLKPVFSSNSEVAANQRKTLINDILNSGKFELNDKGSIIPLNEDGKVLLDDHKNPVKYDDIVINRTKSLFDIQVAKDRSSSGGAGGSDDDKEKPSFKWDGNAPKNSNEYIKLIQSAGSLEEKAAITESWKEVKDSTN